MSRSRKRPYTGSKRFDRSCRNHGSCSYCRGNRLCSRHRAERAAKQQVQEWLTAVEEQLAELEDNEDEM